jgi:hypothetical protein
LASTPAHRITTVAAITVIIATIIGIDDPAAR